jgi:hypothetical protein
MKSQGNYITYFNQGCRYCELDLNQEPTESKPEDFRFI